VFDFETDGKFAETANPVQLAAVILHPGSLETIAEFESKMRPKGVTGKTYFEDHKETIEWHAKLHKTTAEKILAAWKKHPDSQVVWTSFFEFISKYHMRQGNIGSFTAPIPGGYNIVNFDLPIAQRLCEQYGFVDTKGNSKIFSKVNKFDVYDIVFSWFENLNEPEKLSMDYMRPFLGMSTDGAHDALQDVKDTTAILVRFLNFQRRLGSVEKFKDCFK
jgi:DNA polymerase III epsilon subunit-like protein